MIEGCLNTPCPGPGNVKFKNKILLQLGTKILPRITTTNIDDTSISANNDNTGSATNKNSVRGNKNAYKHTPIEKLDSVVKTLCNWSNLSKKKGQ